MKRKIQTVNTILALSSDIEIELFSLIFSKWKLKITTVKSLAHKENFIEN